jgi:dolichyl-phosphate beta-glucosyltransferase
MALIRLPRVPRAPHGPRVSIVMPAYNEARRIWHSLQTLRRDLYGSRLDWEIRVVDDGSEDETAEIVSHVAREERRVMLQREPHRGKGGAVRAGMLAGSAADLCFLCDADLSMPIRELSRFLAKVPRECDIAIGSREGESSRRIGEPFYRHAMGRVFNALVRRSVLPDIRDSQCGFKMFTARAARAVFSAVTIPGWAFDIEVLVIARAQGWRISEVPIEWHHHLDSRVAPVRDSYRMLRDLWAIRANTRRGTYRAAASSFRATSDAEEAEARPARRRSSGSR